MRLTITKLLTFLAILITSILFGIQLIQAVNTAKTLPIIGAASCLFATWFLLISLNTRKRIHR